ncbi:GIY-YIG nuclease family protein [Chitinilyticum litopenaei]|uniref:GIY-YIG nuclease family protein n=1 Tax=Chitinilyticum litopenaei TaxID=1121276 RepID=UPI0003FC08DC|nr:GIY-YIG nuclease family protein [Chitinilyticum litopenaei]
MTWFVYLLECADGSIYTGISTDVWKRFEMHAAGLGARYTRSHPPRALLAVLSCPDRGSASRLEYRLKQLRAPAKRQLACELTGPWQIPQGIKS